MKKRTCLLLFTCLLSLLLAVFAPCIASAAEVVYVELDLAEGDIVIGKDYFTVGTSDEITYTGNYLIKYTEGGDNRLRVSGAKCNIIFDNVQMSVTKQSVSFEKNADVKLILRGTNKVIFSDATKVGTAVAVSANSKLTIEAEGATDSLEVFGGAYGAGLGSPVDCLDVSSQIIINSGIITASCGNSNASEAAAIGGGRSSGAQITINGGIVNATGVRNGPGIGAGRAAPAGTTVTINGGLVYAKGGVNSAGIGGGYQSSADVVINGGVVTSVSGHAKMLGIGQGVDYDKMESEKGATKVELNGGSVLSCSGALDTINADAATLTRNENSTLKLTQVTLPEASDYVYIDDKAVLLDGTHAENSNLYYFWLTEGTHTVAFGTHTVTATVGVEVAADGWSVAEQAVSKPSTSEPAEKDTVKVISPSEIPQAPAPGDDGNDNQDDAQVTTGSNDNVETKAPATAAPETTAVPATAEAPATNEEKGCASSLTAASMALIVFAVAGAGVTLHKKKES